MTFFLCCFFKITNCIDMLFSPAPYLEVKLVKYLTFMGG